MRILLASFSVLVILPGIASATLFAVETPVGGLPNGIAFTGPEDSAFSNLNLLTDSNGSSLWISYLLGVSASAGEKVSALEVSLKTAGPNGGFLQRWTYDQDAGAYTIPTPNSTNITSGDSHLIVGGSVVIRGPSEDRVAKLNDADTTTPGFTTQHLGEVAGIRNYGIGTTMSGLWGFTSTQQASQAGSPVNFAYIVIPRGSEGNLQITANAATTLPNGLPGPDYRFTNPDFHFAQPDRPIIDVRSNAVSIQDDAITTSVGNNTNFGVVHPNSLQQHSFTIVNSGQSQLTLGQPTFTGPFSLVGAFPTSVNPSSSTAFTIGLDTTTLGNDSGSISFATNDPFANPFNFALAAKVSAIDVFGNAILVPNNGTPNLGNGTHFGSVLQGSSQQRTFTIQNSANTPITLESPIVTGRFSLLGSFPSSIPALSSASFSVGLDTSLIGTANGSLAFGNSDPSNNPYNFPLSADIVKNVTNGPKVFGVFKRIGGQPGGAAFTGPESDAASNLNGLTDQSGNSLWVSYALGVKTSPGQKITSLNIALNSSGPDGGFLQRWTAADDPGQYTATTPSSTNMTNGDSHLIESGSVVVTAPNENMTPKSDVSDTTTPGFATPHLGFVDGARNYGIGTYLAGLWGFTSAQQAAQVDGEPVYFAYIVVPRKYDLSKLLIQADVATLLSDGSTGPSYILRGSDFGFLTFVPEPASVWLLGLAMVGSLGFIRRRPKLVQLARE